MPAKGMVVEETDLSYDGGIEGARAEAADLEELSRLYRRRSESREVILPPFRMKFVEKVRA